MANKKVSIDFEKIFHNVMTYFRNLTTDLIIAYAVLAVGIVALIISFVL
jgi:hypothetical protein